jgi:hypothetical protein
MANDERLERIIRIDEAVALFEQRFLPQQTFREFQERFDQHDRRRQDRTQRQRIERR